MEAIELIELPVSEATTLSTYELERGKSMPSTNHSRLQARLCKEILVAYEDLFEVRSEQSLAAPNPPFVPDLSIFPAEASDWLHDETKETDVPLTVIEIVSPSQSDTELTQKAHDYLAAGTKSYWLVQPLFRTVVILRSNADELVFHNNQLTDPTNGISIDLKKIFR
jgi:Uma2 family endonuclease